MVHARHVSAACHVHLAHAHVLHGQQRTLPDQGDRRDHAEARGQRRTDLARAVDRLGNKAVSLVRCRLDNHIVGFGDGDLELVSLDRLHVLPVGGDHRHRQPRDANIEVGHCRSIDDPQANALARSEQSGPVGGAIMAVDKKVVGGTGHIRNVGRVHAHSGPHPPFGCGLVLACQAASQGLLLHVEVSALRLQLSQDCVRMHEAPVGEQDHMLAVIGHGIRTGRIDYDRTIEAHGFLHARMAVIPVGAGLSDGKLIRVGGPRLDPREADAGNTVHLEWEQQAVPVDRTVLAERIGHREADILAFLEANDWSRGGTVDPDGMAFAAADTNHRMTDRQRNVLARNRRQWCCQPRRPAASPSRQCRRQRKSPASPGGGTDQCASIEGDCCHRGYRMKLRIVTSPYAASGLTP